MKRPVSDPVNGLVAVNGLDLSGITVLLVPVELSSEEGPPCVTDPM